MQYNTPPDLLDTISGLQKRIVALETKAPRLYAEALGEVSTGSTTPVDLGGPNITLQVPVNAFIVIYAQVDVKAPGGGNGNVALVDTIDPGALLIQATNSFYQTYGTAPKANNNTSPPLVGALTFPPTPGPHTYSLQYAASVGTAFFKNRRLWVAIN